MNRLLFKIMLLLPLVSSCEKDEGLNKELREIAWNSLTESEKSSLTVDWKDAPVKLTTYNSQSAYSVTFNTSLDPLLGPIIVYIDENTKLVLGQAPRL